MRKQQIKGVVWYQGTSQNQNHLKRMATLLKKDSPGFAFYKQPEEFKNLATKARGPPADPNVIAVPQWFSKAKFERGQRICKKYSASISFAGFCGQVTGCNMKRILGVLLYTGQSSTLSRIYNRNLGQILHLREWYENDPFDPRTKAHDSMKLVNKLHAHIFEKINMEQCRVSGENMVWMSQYDIAVLQVVFIGLLVLFPKKCGFHGKLDELESIVYVWRVFGYLMGLEDRFNPLFGSLRECRHFICLQLTNELSNYDPIALKMSQSIKEATKTLVPFFSWNVIFKYWNDSLDINMDLKLRLSERAFYGLCKLHFRVLSRLAVCRLTSNRIMNRLVLRNVKNRKKIHDQKGSEVIFHKGCPFNLDEI